MAEIEEVFQDVADNTKKLVKSKPFKVAAVCVAGVALYVALTRNQQEEDAQAYGAIGYAGYPSVTGGETGTEGSDSSYFEQILADMQAAQDQNFSDLYGHLSDMQAQLDQNDLNSNSNVTGYRQVSQSDDSDDEMLAYIQKQNAISQMRANSELYNNITDRAMKDALHAENLAIAEQFGWTYDPTTYNYYENGQVLYTTAKQDAGLLGLAPKAPSTGEVTFKNNVDYQAEINKAIMSGAPATTINSLNEQRNAKIAAQGGLTAAQSSGYDKNVDYSLAIKKAKEAGADASVIKNLETQRQNKINAVYGGKDPAKTTTATKSTTSSTSTKSTANAGKTVVEGNYKVTYNENGYVSRKTKIK